MHYKLWYNKNSERKDFMNHYLPSSIMKIAKDLGFRVIEKMPKNDDIACVIRDENDGVVKFIYINSTLPSPRKRFLVALALAYYKLDAYENEKYYKRITLRDHPDLEIMRKAIHLLLPTPLMVDILRKNKLTEENVPIWADVLEVEPSVFKYRVKEITKRRKKNEE